MTEELNTELKDYILNFFSHLMTQEESIAYYNLRFINRLEHTKSGLMKEEIKKRIIKNKVAQELENLGWVDFHTKWITRVWNERSSEIFLNLCPKCNGLARTPEAQQCRHCYYQWHDSLESSQPY